VAVAAVVVAAQIAAIDASAIQVPRD
jgi:hypothetical protein